MITEYLCEIKKILSRDIKNSRSVPECSPHSALCVKNIIHTNQKIISFLRQDIHHAFIENQKGGGELDKYIEEIKNATSSLKKSGDKLKNLELNEVIQTSIDLVKFLGTIIKDNGNKNIDTIQRQIVEINKKLEQYLQ